MKITVLLPIWLLVVTFSFLGASAADDKSRSANGKLPDKRTANIDLEYRQQILNGQWCIPGVGELDYPITFKHGQGKLPTGEGDATISGITFGTLDKVPVAVAGASVWEGGSGQFHYLLLFEVKNKKLTQAGSYSVGDRTSFNHPVIENNHISLSTEQMIGTDHGKKEHLTISRKDFEPLKCTADNEK